MRGFPKYQDITTKQDIDNLLPLFPNETKEFLQQLALDAFVWQPEGELLQFKELGLEDATHQLEEIKDDDTLLGYRQLVLVEDPNSRLHRLGYTLAQVTELVNKLS